MKMCENKFPVTHYLTTSEVVTLSHALGKCEIKMILPARKVLMCAKH